MPNADDLAGLVLDEDVVWVGGGSVANLLAAVAAARTGPGLPPGRGGRGGAQRGLGRVDLLARRRTTDSFGPDLRRVTNGLGFLPDANGVHYDGEGAAPPQVSSVHGRGHPARRLRPDDNAGLVYRGTELAEAVAEVPGKAAYQVSLVDGEVREERLDTRLLPGA